MNASVLADRPDPLRVPEVLIVVSVLLIWCASIFIFIRHSELLRIRHRDLPFRSIIKIPIASNHISMVPHTSDAMISPKGRLSSTGGLTPPTFAHAMHGSKNKEISETKPKPIPSLAQQQRQTHSFDLNPSCSMKETSHFQPEDKQNLLDPHRLPSETRASLLNLQRQSMENVSAMLYTTSFSANEMSRRKYRDSPRQLHKKRCIQESPV